MDKFAMSSLTSTPWYYDHSDQVARIRVSPAADGSSKWLARKGIVTPARYVVLVLQELADFLEPYGFEVGTPCTDNHATFAGQAFRHSCTVALNGLKPAPWLIEPLVCAFLLERACAMGPLYSRYEALALENQGLTRTLAARQSRIEDILRQQFEPELERAQARINALESELEATCAEYNELVELWERTDEALRSRTMQYACKVDHGDEDEHKQEE
jgi:hypothetical protein